MKLIIDISEEEYKRIIKGNWLGESMAEIFENGTPLPKGHGRLIDAKKALDKISCVYDANVIRDAQTIIEADTERSEKEE